MVVDGAVPAKVGGARYWRILIPVCLAFGVCAIDRANIAVAVPTIATDFQLSTAVVGVVLSAFFWGYVPVQLPGAVFGQYVNAKWLITGSLIGWCVGTVLTGVSANLHELIACRILVGISEGAAVPTLLVMIRRWFPLEERGRASSTFFVFGQAGNLVGSGITGILIARTSWHTMFFIEAVPPLVVAAIVAIWVAEDPERDPRLGRKERDWLLESRRREAAETGTVETPHWSTVMRAPLLWGFVVVWVMSSVGSYGLQTWVPTVIKEVTRTGIANVGLLSAIPYLLAIVLLFLVGYLSDRLHRRDLFILLGFVIAGLAILVGPNLSGSVPKLIVIFLGAGCNAAITGIIIAWMEDLTPRGHVGIAIGTIQLFGQMAGIAAPLAVGFVAGTRPAVTAIWIVGVGLFVGAAVTALLYVAARQRARRAAPAAAPAEVR
jgi:MFS family permease